MRKDSRSSQIAVRRSAIAVALLAASVTVGCGYKGDLVLPAEQNSDVIARDIVTTGQSINTVDEGTVGGSAVIDAGTPAVEPVVQTADTQNEVTPAVEAANANSVVVDIPATLEDDDTTNKKDNKTQ